MCGIFGVVVNNHHKRLLRNLYEIYVYQQSRGGQGAGVSIHNMGSRFEKEELFRHRTVSPTRLFNVYNWWVWRRVKEGSRIIVHHRHPTSTSNIAKCNHPIANEDDSIHFIHNGVVSNDNVLYKELKKTHSFETMETKKRFTDSEVIVHVFEENLKDGVVNAFREVYHRVDGSYAIALMLKGDDSIYLMRNWNPIIISKDSDGNHYFSSELNRLDSTLSYEHTLDDGEIGKLTAEGYVKLDKIDIPPRKNRQRTLYDEREWDDTEDKTDDDTPVAASVLDDTTGFTDAWGNTIIRKGDYWVEADKSMKRGYDYD